MASLEQRGIGILRPLWLVRRQVAFGLASGFSVNEIAEIIGVGPAIVEDFFWQFVNACWLRGRGNERTLRGILMLRLNSANKTDYESHVRSRRRIAA
jgi:hypothetical protein